MGALERQLEERTLTGAGTFFDYDFVRGIIIAILVLAVCLVSCGVVH